MNRVLLFAASERGFVSCKRLLESDVGSLAVVVTFHEVNVAKDWAVDIINLCKTNNIYVYLWKEVRDNICTIIKNENISSAFAISWKYYIDLQINQFLKHNLVVFHDSLLPKYRGFAPTPTAIICGEKEVGVTALYADTDIDCGDILLQRSLLVDSNETILEIIERESEIYAEMLLELVRRFEVGDIESYKQNHGEATYSIWRDIDDCHIKWNQSALQIHNFVRALGNPYIGAYTFWNDKKIYVDKTRIEDYDYLFAIRDCGKIWSLDKGQPIIICGTGMIRIVKAHDEAGERVLFNSLRIRLK